MSDRADIRGLDLSPSEEGASGLTDQATRTWEKFSHWVCCMCIVTFDLELGQALEVN